MRHYILTAAAFAACVLASADPAHAQNAAKLQQLCPDMTFNQIGTKLAVLVEKYEFDRNPDVALLQAAEQLCPDQLQQQTEAPQAEPQAQPKVMEAVVSPPPPGYRPPPPGPAPLPHFNGPMPRFAPPPPQRRIVLPPPRRHGPPVVVVAPVPRPAPPAYGYSPRPPQVAGNGYYGQQGGYVQERPRALPLTKSERGEAFCLAEQDPEAFARKYPMPPGYRPGACMIGAIPNQPCPGWVCKR